MFGIEIRFLFLKSFYFNSIEIKKIAGENPKNDSRNLALTFFFTKKKIKKGTIKNRMVYIKSAVQSPECVKYSKFRMPSSKKAMQLVSRKLIKIRNATYFDSIKKPFQYKTAYINIYFLRY